MQKASNKNDERLLVVIFLPCKRQMKAPTLQYSNAFINISPIILSSRITTKCYIIHIWNTKQDEVSIIESKQYNKNHSCIITNKLDVHYIQQDLRTCKFFYIILRHEDIFLSITSYYSKLGAKNWIIVLIWSCYEWS